MSQVGRFFRAKMLLVSGGLLLVAFLGTLLVINDFFSNNRIHIGGGLTALLFGVLGLASITLAFPRGCKRCGVVLARRMGMYAPELYEPLAGLLAAPDPAGIAHFAPQRTMAVLHHRASVDVESCPRCARVMVVKVVEEQWKESYYHANRTSPDHEYTDDVAAALLGLVG